MKLLRAHYMGKPILAAHFMGRRLLLDDIYAAENGGILFGDEALPLHATARFAEADSSEAFGDEAEGDTADAVFSEAEDGLPLGSAPVGEAYLDVSPTPVGVLGLEHETPYINGASRLPTPNGAIGLEHSTPYINGASHIPEINGSIITGHEAPAINGASKLEAVNDGAAVKQYTETLTADCVFHEADDGTGAGENVEMFKTVVPVWGEGSNGGGFGEDAEGVIFDSAYAGANSGEAFGNEAEAYVETPTTPNIIAAGVYRGKTNVTDIEAIDINLPVECTYNGTVYSFVRIANANRLNIYGYYSGGGSEHFAAIITLMGNPYVFIRSDDYCMTVTSDTEVDETQYDIFNNYFEQIQ